MRRAILAYGILNAILYAGLLPLWDGFDEPFHYAYVQQISQHGTIPAPGSAVLSREVWDSLDLVPVAEGVRKNIPKAISFSQYFPLSPGERSELRRRLDTLAPRSGSLLSDANNYEAQQAPLEYVLLAPLDALVSGKPLLWRVLFLRLVCAVGAVLLTAWGMESLGSLLAMPPPFAHAALFVVFSSQMFYAATAHITNDWLAVPVLTLLLAQGVTLDRAPRTRAALWFAATLGAALLTKAYFLAVVPLALWLAITRRWEVLLGLAIAAPWYARNLLRYGNLSGMQETAGGMPAGELLHAALRLPWGQTLWSTAHSALFTGNNSYIAFSAVTLSIMLALLAVAAFLYFSRGVAGERIVLAGSVLMILGITYSTVVAFWFSHGVATTPAPWYWQVLLPPGMILLMLGLSRKARFGSWTATAIGMAWAYLMGATYVVKLIPFYAGLSDGRSRMSDLPRWYAHVSVETVSPFSTRAVLFLTALVVLSAFTLAVMIARNLRGALPKGN